MMPYDSLVLDKSAHPVLLES